MFGNKDRAFDRITGGGGPEREGLGRSRQGPPQGQALLLLVRLRRRPRSWAISEEAPKYDPKERDRPAHMVDTEITRQDLAGYYHEVSRFDHTSG